MSLSVNKQFDKLSQKDCILIDGKNYLIVNTSVETKTLV